MAWRVFDVGSELVVESYMERVVILGVVESFSVDSSVVSGSFGGTNFTWLLALRYFSSVMTRDR